MTRPIRRTLPLALSLLLLAACGGAPAPRPALTGTLNGSRVVSDQTVEFGFTPLNEGLITETAVIKDVQVTGLSAGQATAATCGGKGLRLEPSAVTAISIDSTGSMSWSDPKEHRKTAAKNYVKRMNKNDLGAILSFDSTTVPSEGMRGSYLWQDFTGIPGHLISAIEHATFVGGNTPMYDAALDGLDLLIKHGGDNRTLLILTDGEDNSSAALPEEVVALAKQHDIRIYIVGLNDAGAQNFKNAEFIVSSTGGLFQETKSSVELETFFDNVYNSLHAEGCLQLTFTEKPSAGTVVSGKLNVTVSDEGKPDTTVITPFSVTIR